MKDTLVKALVDEWTAIDGLLTALPPADWAKPTALPGWSVQDVVSHIVGGELGLAGQQPPVTKKSFAHVRNDIGTINEYWVDWLRAESPDEVHARFRSATTQRAQVLQDMTSEDFDAPSWTPAGQGTYGRFMRIRLFDCWMHEQDIREAVGHQGNESGPSAEISLDEITAALGYIVGKRAAAPAGASVTFHLTGPVERALHVLVDGRAKVVDSLPGPATVTLVLTSSLFARLCGGRTPVGERVAEIHFDGDRELGERVAHALPFTI
ncbi:maleylpyruvate isomerase family mycothiol-dependent enzyme [Actinocrispum wychmicini]|uniref:Uncharacterized protein (TIGR03083 family) n=1 Tax=Actinocrispum wychmicini TaxID=1213861 RepID=A0A4R2IVR3_9PSEU|nr:maleylpyruvate isomerase family mycothiol-dependent enzyme [Actinocrispum wychmicini]TCO48842.1 uncharacterized protein (TIGR03083 family) [Actinocrispum wychmicini]